MLQDLIPQGSVITPDMVTTFAAETGVEITDDNLPGLVGSLAAWESGKGSFDDGLATNPVFAPLLEAYLEASSATQDGTFTPQVPTTE